MIAVFLFCSLVLLLLVVISYFIINNLKRSSLVMVIIGWLIITGFLAKIGFFLDFNSLPPRILLVVFPMVVFIFYISFTSKVLPLLSRMTQQWLIGIQSFRVIMEVVLWLLADQHLIPELLTWNGRNFDIIIGLSAPFLAYFCFVSPKWSEKVAFGWNVLGILLLINVFTHGFLSAPLPFQVFFTDPPNTFLATFPYIWLPGFVVPSAFLFHVLSLRKMISKE